MGKIYVLVYCLQTRGRAEFNFHLSLKSKHTNGMFDCGKIRKKGRFFFLT